ncbi:MAG: SH3 domain-containing protein [Nitrospiraceae bacterium]|nr:SH3 domain-containing protein [Nitrospiraceae bacterium]
MTRKLPIAGLIIVMVFVAGYAEPLCVNAGQANVRTGPGTGYKIVWEVYRHMPFAKVGVSLSGSWYAVQDVDGDVNWIHKGLVTSSYRCAIVKSKTANIRTGPGLLYAEKFTEPAKKYDTFRVLKKKGAWVKVRDEYRDNGWIYGKLLWIH